MNVISLLDDLIIDVRQVYGLAATFYMSPLAYAKMIREFQQLNPYIRQIDEYRGIPITVSPEMEIGTVFFVAV